MSRNKRTKAVDISLDVRKKVYERSGGKCETCGKWCDDIGFSNSHYIPRSNNGLGIEQNILHQCQKCHYIMDFGNKEERVKMKHKARLVLVSYYGEFEDEELKWRWELNHE